MSGFDWLVVIVMGVVGWLVVSFLLNRSKPGAGEDGQKDTRDADFSRPGGAAGGGEGYGQRESAVRRLPAPASPEAPVKASAPTPARAPDSMDIGDSSASLSLDEMGRSWNVILGVRSDASAAEIETAYHARLAECDRARFAADATPSTRLAAEQQRARINQAYEFIRPSRQ